jgi:hypothetical protein
MAGQARSHTGGVNVEPVVDSLFPKKTAEYRITGPTWCMTTVPGATV